jgi:hypothetical protein
MQLVSNMLGLKCEGKDKDDYSVYCIKIKLVGLKIVPALFSSSVSSSSSWLPLAAVLIGTPPSVFRNTDCQSFVGLICDYCGNTLHLEPHRCGNQITYGPTVWKYTTLRATSVWKSNHLWPDGVEIHYT